MKISSHLLINTCRYGYFVLVLMLTCWFLTQTVQSYSWWFRWLWIVPLLLPMRGIYQKQIYTFAWTGYVLSVYLSYFIMVIWMYPSVRIYAVLLTIYTLTLFIAMVFVPKLSNREGHTSDTF